MLGGRGDVQWQERCVVLVSNEFYMAPKDL